MMDLNQRSLNLEGLALGSLIRDPDAIMKLGVQREDFSQAFHIELFDEIERARADGSPHNGKSLARHFGDVEVDDGLSASDYIAKIVIASTDSEDEPRRVAADLRDVATRRAVVHLADELQVSAADKDAKIVPLIGDAREKLNEVVARTGLRKTGVTVGQASENVVSSLKGKNANPPVRTNLKTIDKSLGGLVRGDFIVLAGRPSMGKSMVVSSVGYAAARQGYGVMLFTLEMSGEEIAARCLADVTGIPYTKMLRNNVNADELGRIEDAAAEHKKLTLQISDKRLTISGLTQNVMAQREIWLSEGKSLDLLIVDHVGHMQASDRYRGNKVHEVTEISNGLLALAKELNIPVIGVSQLNRNTEGRDNKRPTMSDLRDSGSLEQDANVLLFLYRHAYYLERAKYDDSEKESRRLAALDACRNAIEIGVAKNRNGPVENLTMSCDVATNQLRDIGSDKRYDGRPSHIIGGQNDG